MSVTFEMPTLDPSRAGLTKQGGVIPAAASSASWSCFTPARKVTLRAVAMPTLASSGLTRSLSIVTAEPATPEPTYGSPTISSMPWTVPSSPKGPCRIGSTTSIAVDRAARGDGPGAGDERSRCVTRREGELLARPAAPSAPCLSISISTTS